MITNKDCENFDHVNKRCDNWDRLLECKCFKAPMKMADVVNPSHYKQGTVECYDAIASMLSQEELRGYLRGNSLKYRWRYRQKGGVTDLEKAAWYEAKLIEMERGK